MLHVEMAKTRKARVTTGVTIRPSPSAANRPSRRQRRVGRSILHRNWRALHWRDAAARRTWDKQQQGAVSGIAAPCDRTRQATSCGAKIRGAAWQARHPERRPCPSLRQATQVAVVAAAAPVAWHWTHCIEQTLQHARRTGGVASRPAGLTLHARLQMAW